LARVSLVDWNGNTLLDTFVQVPQRVTDFRTHVSGVRPSDITYKDSTPSQTLLDVTTCRKKVGQLLEGKIVIGHALQNDFRALMLHHPKERIRDTARYPPLMKARGKNGGKLRPRKLRDLVYEYVMGMEIQKKGQAHSSVEDAIGVMEVYKSVRDGWEKYLDEKKNPKKKTEHKKVVL
jgi:RNA exonuclease 4